MEPLAAHRKPWRTVCYLQENGRLYVWPSKEGSARSLQRSSFRENATNCMTFIPEYVTGFLGQTDAPEARCDLMDRLIHRQDNCSNPCTCMPRVKCD